MYNIDIKELRKFFWGNKMFKRIVFTARYNENNITISVRRGRGKYNSTYFVFVLNEVGTLGWIKNQPKDKYYYVGYIGEYCRIHTSPKSVVTPFDLAFTASSYVISRICIRSIKNGVEIDSGITFTYNGLCAYCGRELTDPKTIKVGAGGRCLKKVKDIVSHTTVRISC